MQFRNPETPGAESGEVELLESNLNTPVITSSGKTEITQLEDLIPKSGMPPYQIAILALLAIGAFFVLWRILKHKNTPQNKAAVTVYRRSKSEIETLLGSSSDCSTNEIATKLSLIIRNFITHISGDPTLYETHEEFAYRSNALAKFPESAANKIRAFFDKVSSYKYGPITNNGDLSNELCKEALGLLSGLESTRKKVIA